MSADPVSIELPLSVQAALQRIARRIGEGFQGEITLAVNRGGVSTLRWIEVESGEAIRKELERP